MLFLIWYLIPSNALCLLAKCKWKHDKAMNFTVICEKKPSQTATAGCCPEGNLRNNPATLVQQILLCKSRETAGNELLASKYLNFKLISHSSELYEFSSSDDNLSVSRWLNKACRTPVFWLSVPVIYTLRDLLQVYKGS